MSTYRVRYYYLATGMEGRADSYAVGHYRADTAEQAIELAIDHYYGGKDRE